jgi:hypothetical protein
MSDTSKSSWRLGAGLSAIGRSMLAPSPATRSADAPIRGAPAGGLAKLGELGEVGSAAYRLARYRSRRCPSAPSPGVRPRC